MLSLFKSLADNTRLRLIAILDQGEFTVQELVEILVMGQSRVSRHLKILAEAGVVSVKREGTWGYYRLDPSNQLFRDLLPLLREQFAGLDGAQVDAANMTEVMAERRQRSQLFFEQHASDWDHLVHLLLPTPDYQVPMIEALDCCAVLVEIGVGTGRLLPVLSRKAQRVIGIDHAPAMLQAARERVAESCLLNVELRLGEMEHLPLESAAVDVALLNMVLHHAASPEEVLHEVARVLRPGGRLMVVDLFQHQQEWAREKLADQWLGFAGDELIQWCRNAGFVEPDYSIIEADDDQYSVLQLNATKPKLKE
mgnify:CR=1 FL=1